MNTMRRQARLFRLVRRAGASGTLAEGVEWSDGSVALRWRGPWVSTSTWDCVEALLAVHGTDGRTVLQWWSDPAPVERAETPPVRSAEGEALPAAVWLPAPGADGLCARCGRLWPCLGCGLQPP